MTYLVRPPTSHTTRNAGAWLTHVLSRSVEDGKLLVDVGETGVNDVQPDRFGSQEHAAQNFVKVLKRCQMIEKLRRRSCSAVTPSPL